MSEGEVESDSFKRFYNEKPTHTTSDPGLQELIESYIVKLNLPRSPKILDAGCGDGRVLKALRHLLPDAELFGVDISEPNVQMLRGEGLQVYQGDLSTGNLPFADHFFDLCIMFHTIEHLYDTDHSLREINRVLKGESGIFLILTPNLAFWINRLLLAIGIQPLHTEVSADKVLGRRFGFLGQGNPVVGHIHVFTLPALLDILKINGFTVLNVRGFPDPRLKRVSKSVDFVLSKRASLSTSFLVTCKTSLDAAKRSA